MSRLVVLYVILFNSILLAIKYLIFLLILYSINKAISIAT
jgi:hypothetical protein